MPSSYSPFCDDFYVNMRLGTQMPLPQQRETLLHFFEQVQKAFPGMSRFRRTELGELTLEEDRNGPGYRWMSIEPQRLGAGHVNPESVAEALRLHHLLLELAPYQLSLSSVEMDFFDLLFGFDLEYGGNHDEIIAESLMADSPLTCLMDEPEAKAVDFQPQVTVALSDDCRVQARIEVVTRTSSYQIRTGDFAEDVISVYLVLRRYWGDGLRQPFTELLQEFAERADRLCVDHVVPKILRPISEMIASRS